METHKALEIQAKQQNHQFKDVIPINEPKMSNKRLCQKAELFQNQQKAQSPQKHLRNTFFAIRTHQKTSKKHLFCYPFAPTSHLQPPQVAQEVSVFTASSLPRVRLTKKQFGLVGETQRSKVRLFVGCGSTQPGTNRVLVHFSFYQGFLGTQYFWPTGSSSLLVLRTSWRFFLLVFNSVF